MGRLLKYLLIAVAAVVGIVVLAAVALLVFFDPNDFRDNLSARVQEATGREMAIEGELDVSLFPWLAVEVGRTRLGNAEGFGPEPFATFEQARLSVRLLPLLLRQEVTIGQASLTGLDLNLEVAADGRNNWADLAEAETDAAPAEPSDDAPSEFELDVAGISVTGATLSYRDRQAGSSYAVENLSFETGRVAIGVPFAVNAEFDFTSEPGELGGHVVMGTLATIGTGFSKLTLADLEIDGELSGLAPQPAEVAFAAPELVLDLNAESVTAGTMEFSALGVDASAKVEPFSYAGPLEAQAHLEVEPFSLKQLLAKLGTEPPVTANPDALTKVAFRGRATLGETALLMRDLALTLDATTLEGTLTLPLTDEGLIEFDLSADSIAVDDYMAPADEAAGAEDADATGDVEIPVDLIRALEAEGTVRLARATLSGMLFEDLEVTLASRGGKLRLNPLGAKLFDGSYEGDVRIDASGQVPTISVNERVKDVKLTPLARSMFDQENISGTINGAFVLTGSGGTLDAIRSNLDGNMAFELADGAWEGTDLWYQIRSARALFKKESPPEKRNPPRTEFSSVVISGNVTDGIFRNEELLAELPFLQVTGDGTVDLVEATVDYALSARVLERPEFAGKATPAELDEFTEAVVPLSVTGPLASPKVRPDIDGMLKAKVKGKVEEKKEELRGKLMERLLGGDEKKEEPAPANAADSGAQQEQQPEKKDLEDELKDSLKKIFRE